VDGVIAYWILVSGWGDPLVFASSSITATVGDLQLVFAALPAIFVQCFFTWRIWTFCMAVCRRWMKLAAAAICLFITCTIICALISAITLFGISLSPVFYPEPSFRKLILTWIVSTAVADLTITATMLTILYHATSSACFGEMQDRISLLLRLTLQTGFLTSILAMPVVPIYFTNGSGIYSLPIFLLGESYVISLLANLNARSYHPTSPDHAHGIDNVAVPHVSSLRFTTSQPQNCASNGELSVGSGILSFIRSIAHTIRRDLTETTHERTSRMEREAQLIDFGEEAPGSNQAKENDASEAQV